MDKHKIIVTLLIIAVLLALYHVYQMYKGKEQFEFIKSVGRKEWPRNNWYKPTAPVLSNLSEEEINKASQVPSCANSISNLNKEYCNVTSQGKLIKALKDVDDTCGSNFPVVQKLDQQCVTPSWTQIQGGLYMHS
jgi:hypothetical protein